MKQSRRVRIVGRLDGFEVPSQTFTLSLGNEQVQAVLCGGSMDQLAALLNKQVLAFGRAVFGLSGCLLRLDVDDFREATDADQYFAKMPNAMVKAERKTPEQSAAGLREVMGKWPGDESDEQVREALGEPR